VKKTVLACLATLALTHPAHAAAGTCLDVADPAGDGPVHGLAADPADLVRVSAVASDSAVTATFRVNGALPVESPYGYTLGFTDDGHEYKLHAHILKTQGYFGYELRVRTETVSSGGNAEVSGWEVLAATGSIDAATGTVTITAPAALFGATSLTGHVWHATIAQTVVGAANSSAGPFDEVALGNAALVGGDGTCA
jgi:hypothetical protein